jgi:hypothetical protein
MEVRLTEGQQAYHNRAAIVVLARQAAKKAVKRQLQAQGIKPGLRSAREIALLADDCLLTHRTELREHATAQYRRCVKSGRSASAETIEETSPMTAHVKRIV